MCAEKIEEITNAQVNPPKASTFSTWAPALAVLIGLPIVSFLFTEYVLSPRLQKQITQALQQSMDPELSPSDTPTSPNEATVQTYELKDIVGNLIGSGQSRYIRVSYVVEGTQPNFSELMEQHKAQLIDTTLSILALLSTDDLSKPNIKDIVRTQLLQNFEQVLQNKYIKSLFFSQFIIK